jgi:hypothetical protein
MKWNVRVFSGSPRLILDPLRALVGEIVRCLNDENLKHHHWIERRRAALRPIGTGKRRFEVRTK